MTTTTKKDGFTLVELAIVIVIIGFLVAGIAAGSNMIRQAELRSLVTDLQAYQTAYNNFLGRYNAVAGDFGSASSFWSNCATTTNGNCDGDGDGVIEHGTTAATNEPLHAWRHLALAGMISAGIEQMAATNDGTMTIGTQAPSSKKSGVGFMMAGGNTNIAAGGTGAITSPFGASTNAVYMGRGGIATNALIAGALTAEEAFNIDQKLDDGLVTGGNFAGATTGVIRSVDGSGATLGDCATGTNYDIDNTNSACVTGLALN